jgi:hypothetical protein
MGLVREDGSHTAAIATAVRISDLFLIPPLAGPANFYFDIPTTYMHIWGVVHSSALALCTPEHSCIPDLVTVYLLVFYFVDFV